MTKLQHYSHLLLNSKYKFLLTLFLYSLIIILYNNGHEIYCIEEKKENIILSANSDSYNLSEKLIGSALFFTSILFTLFIQYTTNSVDPGIIVDTASHIINSPIISDISTPIITELPSCLDSFQINDVGDILINGNKIDLDNVYLNASLVEHEIVNNILHKQVADYQAFKLLDALAEANLINPELFNLYDVFLQEGNRPENFGAYLNKYLTQNP